MPAQGFEPWTIGLKVCPDLRKDHTYGLPAYSILRLAPPSGTLDRSALAMRNQSRTARPTGAPDLG